MQKPTDTLTTGTAALAPAPALLRAALDASTEAVLLCTAHDDKILLVNAAATAMLPGLVPGGTAADGPLPGLAEASATGAETFTDDHEGRRLYGCRRPLGDDHYGWYLRDTTEDFRRAEAYEHERARTAFLAEAGRRLSSSLHLRRCLRTTVELAVSHLADAAVVVLPARRRQSEWRRLVGGESVEDGRLDQAALGDVPGLEEALGGFPPIPSRWLDPAQAPDWLLPDGFGPAGALLVTPLPGSAEPAGALLLIRRDEAGPFTAEDESLARVFAAR
ncbi:MAG: phosphatase, partial [Actinoplanes sp.]